MSRWVNRLFESHRVALAAVGATSICALGSLGGVILGNFTVSGTAIPAYRPVETVASAPVREPDLAERAATELFGESGARYVPASYSSDTDADRHGGFGR
jgi:hypothetical protein